MKFLTWLLTFNNGLFMGYIAGGSVGSHRYLYLLALIPAALLVAAIEWTVQCSR